MAKPFTWDFEPRNVTFKLRVLGYPKGQRRGEASDVAAVARV